MRNTDLFDDYITNRLSSEEKIEFEKKLGVDEDLRKEFFTHQLFISQMVAVRQNQELKNLMREIHDDEFGSTPVIPINSKINYFRVAAVAAGISILIFVGGISVYKIGRAHV